MTVHQPFVLHPPSSRTLPPLLKMLLTVLPRTFSTLQLSNSSGRPSSNSLASPFPTANNSPSLTTMQCSIRHLALLAVFPGLTKVNEKYSPTAIRWPVTLPIRLASSDMHVGGTRLTTCVFCNGDKHVCAFI
jgi:hypothetical protein